MMLSPTDDLRHSEAAVEEWVFAASTPDGRAGVVSGHRLVAGGDWYWAALVEAGRPLLHLAEWKVVRRSDPFIVKAPEMWAEHHCVAAMKQWSIGNEAHAVALDDPDEALGKAYGVPTPIAMDLEWYAAGDPEPIDDGYRQAGVLHGLVELLDRPNLELAEIPAVRWHRWSDRADIGPVPLEVVVADAGLRAPFTFPNGDVSDWVLSSAGWRARHRQD